MPGMRRAFAFLAATIPAGWVGTEWDRLRAMQLGLAAMVAACCVMTVTQAYWLAFVALALAGTGWALVAVNAIVAVWAMAPPSDVGLFTGIYYVHSSLAAVGACRAARASPAALTPCPQPAPSCSARCLTRWARRASRRV